MATYHSETHFGLEIHPDDPTLLSADSGETWISCPLPHDEFMELRDSVKCWLERPLDETEEADLREICGL